MIKRVLPTNDLAFRKAFATPGNEDVLQGKIEGEQAKAIAIARNHLNAGMPISDISRHTGLAEDEIRKLMH